MIGTPTLRRLATRQLTKDRRLAAGAIIAIAGPVALANAGLGFLISELMAEVPGEENLFHIVVALLVNPFSVIAVALMAMIIHFATAGVFAATARKRTSILGLLRSMGANRSSLLSYLFIEAYTVTLVGILAGTLVGLTVSVWALAQFAPDPGLQARALILAPILPTIAALLGVRTAVRSGAAPTLRGHEAGPARAAPNMTPFPQSGAPPLVSDRAISPSPVLLASTVLMIVCLITFADASSPLPWFGLVGATIGIVWSVAALAPRVLRPLIGGSQAGPFWWRFGLRDLSRTDTRLTKTIGAVVSMSALATMAMAGIKSDLSLVDELETTNVIVIETYARAGVDSGQVLQELRDNGLKVDKLVEVQSFQLWRAWDRNDRRLRGNVTGLILTDELIDVFNLSSPAVQAATDGAVLLNSQVLGSVTLTPMGDFTPSTYRVEDGHGYGTPLPALFVSATTAQIAGGSIPLSTSYVAIFDQPIARSDFQSLSLGSFHVGPTMGISSWRSNDFAPDHLKLIAFVAGLLMVLLGYSAAVVALSEQDGDFSSMIAGGASPSIRRRVPALQSLLTLGLGSAIGCTLGVLLFWVVTRGDESVPHLIIPWSLPLVLVIGAPLVTAGLILISFRSGKPAQSRRDSPQIPVHA